MDSKDIIHTMYYHLVCFLLYDISINSFMMMLLNTVIDKTMSYLDKFII